MRIRLLLLALPCLLTLSCATHTRGTEGRLPPANRPGIKGRKDLIQAVDRQFGKEPFALVMSGRIG